MWMRRRGGSRVPAVHASINVCRWCVTTRKILDLLSFMLSIDYTILFIHFYLYSLISIEHFFCLKIVFSSKY